MSEREISGIQETPAPKTAPAPKKKAGPRKKPGPKPRTPERDGERNKQRPARVQMGSGGKLSVPESLMEEGYQYYQAITGPGHEGTLARMEAAWWEPVIYEGSRVEQPAGRGNTHVLMRIRQEYYDEDIAAQQARNIDTTQSNVQSLGDSEYVPLGQKNVMEREII